MMIGSAFIFGKSGARSEFTLQAAAFDGKLKLELQTVARDNV